MVKHNAVEARSGHSPASRPTGRWLLPVAGGGLGVAALIAHFGIGGALMHVGLPAALAYFGLGAAPGNVGGALVIVIVAVIAVKLLVVSGVFAGAVGARRGWQRHRSHEADQRIAGERHAGSNQHGVDATRADG